MHEPVLVDEVLEALHINKGKKYIDATEGAGGHSIEIVNRGGEVLGLDQDPYMLEMAQMRIANPHLKLINTNFVNIKKTAINNDFDQVDGVLFDLGISSLHYLDTQRGFSFQYPDAKLDMRLDPNTSNVSAADVLNILPEKALEDIFNNILRPFEARRLANHIIKFRENNKFQTVGDFLEVCKFLYSKSGRHPATNAFLALRIAVNSELANIEIALPDALDLLVSKGRLAVITFHSIEDGIVKKIFRGFEEKDLGKVLTKKSIEPSISEISKNPKARSARLRVFEKI